LYPKAWNNGGGKGMPCQHWGREWYIRPVISYIYAFSIYVGFIWSPLDDS
jgi:hypothetical protein